jgi:hypothetical protein
LILALLPPKTLALTTNLTPTADATLFQHNPNNNLGGMDALISGNIVLGERSRALLKFDIAAALPANATVTAATLHLTVNVAKGANQNYGLHRLLKDWGEGGGSGGGGATGTQGAPANPNECTWNARFHPGVTWNVPGGQSGEDYVATASATTAMGVTALTFSTAGLASDVQDWLASPATNFGWMLIIANEALGGTASRISSRESAFNLPRLTIDYTVSGTANPPAPPTLSAPTLEAGFIRFSFNAESNQTYTVQFRNSFGSGDWSNLTNIPAQPTAATIHVTNAVSGVAGYFRVRSP